MKKSVKILSLTNKRVKYDWPKIKNDYFLGKSDNLINFLKERLGENGGLKKINGFIKDSTAGWREERENFKEQQAKKALELADKKMTKEMATSLDNFRKAIVKKSKGKLEKLSAKEFAVFWRILRTECNLPTVIQKNEGVSNVILPTVIIQKDYGSKPIEVDGETD